jgi:hypothetical protein
MAFMKTASAAIALSLVLGTTACKKEESAAPKEEAKPAAPAPAEKPAEPVAAAAAAPAAEPAKKPMEGLQLNAVPAESLNSLNSVAQFSGFGSDTSCDDYAKAITPFFQQFQNEFKALQGNFTPDAAGAAAMRKFGNFLQASAKDLAGVKVGRKDLEGVHAEFVSSVGDLGRGMLDMAGAIERQDQAGMQQAAQFVQTTVTKFQSALNKILQICG